MMEISQCNTHIGGNDLKLSLGFIKHHTMKIYAEGRYCCTEWRRVNFTPELYGEVNSVKKHNYKIWLNDFVY